MVDDSYTQALSLFNQGEYEKALRLIEQSPLNTLREKELLEQCRKQVVEQYCYLINESIAQKDCRTAKFAKDEFKAKYGVNNKIEGIKIPEIQATPSTEELVEKKPNSRKYIVIALGVILVTITAFFIKRKSNQENLLSAKYETSDSVSQRSDDRFISESSKVKSDFRPTYLKCEGDMIGYPIQMEINIDKNSHISGNYLNVKYNVKFVLEGTRSKDGVLRITARHQDAIFYFTLKPIADNKLIGYGSNGKNKLDIHLKVKTFNSLSDDLKRYYNPRFDYNVLYPSSFNIVSESGNGDGCKFSKDDKTYLMVWGMYNNMNETLENKYNQHKDQSPVYCRLKDNWFVISDNTDDGCIFYQKTVLKNDVFITAILHYPSNENNYYSSMISNIFTDFPN